MSSNKASMKARGAKRAKFKVGHAADELEEFLDSRPEPPAEGEKHLEKALERVSPYAGYWKNAVCFMCHGESGQPPSKTVDICERCYAEDAAASPVSPLSKEQVQEGGIHPGDGPVWPVVNPPSLQRSPGDNIVDCFAAQPAQPIDHTKPHIERPECAEVACERFGWNPTAQPAPEGASKCTCPEVPRTGPIPPESATCPVHAAPTAESEAAPPMEPGAVGYSSAACAGDYLPTPDTSNAKLLRVKPRTSEAGVGEERK